MGRCWHGELGTTGQGSAWRAHGISSLERSPSIMVATPSSHPARDQLSWIHPPLCVVTFKVGESPPRLDQVCLYVYHQVCLYLYHQVCMSTIKYACLPAIKYACMSTIDSNVLEYWLHIQAYPVSISVVIT